MVKHFQRHAKVRNVLRAPSRQVRQRRLDLRSIVYWQVRRVVLFIPAKLGHPASNLKIQ